MNHMKKLFVEKARKSFIYMDFTVEISQNKSFDRVREHLFPSDRGRVRKRAFNADLAILRKKIIGLVNDLLDPAPHV